MHNKVNIFKVLTKSNTVLMFIGLCIIMIVE